MKFEFFLVISFFSSSILLGFILPKVVGRKKNGRLLVKSRLSGGWSFAIVTIIYTAVLLAVVLYDMRQWDRFKYPSMMSYGWLVAVIYVVWVLIRGALVLAVYFGMVTAISEWHESILNNLYQNGYLTFWRNGRGELVFGPTVIRNWLRRHMK